MLKTVASANRNPRVNLRVTVLNASQNRRTVVGVSIDLQLDSSLKISLLTPVILDTRPKRYRLVTQSRAEWGVLRKLLASSAAMALCAKLLCKGAFFHDATACYDHFS